MIGPIFSFHSSSRLYECAYAPFGRVEPVYTTL